MRIAVTGGIAEGKSTVMAYLRELGEQTASADDMAREVFQSEEVQAKLAALLGVSGAVAPHQLRERLSADVSLRRQVNRIMHPLVVDLLLSSPAKWIEVPLLFETALHPLFDRVWVTTCGPEIQLERLTARLGNVEVARSMIGTQLPTPVKCAFADEVVWTTGSEEAVREFVRSAISRDFAK